jgi:uncharacterized protein YneR
MNEEAEKWFQDEVNSKKRDRYNLKSKTGSKGSSKSRKGVRTAYDYLSPKERKKLNGTVEVSSLYDVLQDKEWFEGFPLDKQKEILIHWREIYPNSKIMEALQIKSQGAFNTLIKRLGVPKKRPYMKKQIKAQPKEESSKGSEVVAAVPVSEKGKDMDIVIFDGLSLNYNGFYSADQLERIFTKLQLIIQDEEQIKYKVSITLQEV